MTVNRRGLSITPAVDLTPPPDRGRLMTPVEVAAVFFEGKVSAKWVRRVVRPKVALGHSTVMFYEHDVRRWIESRRTEEGAA